jgi:hypothetical protein
MKKTWWGTLIVAVVMIAAGFAAGFFWAKTGQASAGLESETCLPGAMPAGYFELNALLLEFDDAATLAVNLPREQVVAEVEALQRIRRDVDELAVPACLDQVKTSMLIYMNRVVELLVGFVGGVPPMVVLEALEEAQPMRKTLEAEMAKLIGVTLTPRPTPYDFTNLVDPTALVPVTGEVTRATPLPVYAEVTNSDGVNLREGPGVTFNFDITVPVGTRVQVTAISEDGLWVFGRVGEELGGSPGWLYVPLVTLEGPVDELPVLE